MENNTNEILEETTDQKKSQENELTNKDEQNKNSIYTMFGVILGIVAIILILVAILIPDKKDDVVLEGKDLTAYTLIEYCLEDFDRPETVRVVSGKVETHGDEEYQYSFGWFTLSIVESGGKKCTVYYFIQIDSDNDTNIAYELPNKVDSCDVTYSFDEDKVNQKLESLWD